MRRRHSRPQVSRLPRTVAAACAPPRLIQRRTISGAATRGAPTLNPSIEYAGVWLRDMIAGAPGYQPAGRGQRGLVIQALAADGYRAIFSRGELFNRDTTEQVLVVQRPGGQRLGHAEGPLALRALRHLKPAPRHVSKLCAIIMNKLEAALKQQAFHCFHFSGAAPTAAATTT